MLMLSLNVKFHHIGIVIGKCGNNIKRMYREYGCHISVRSALLDTSTNTVPVILSFQDMDINHTVVHLELCRDALCDFINSHLLLNETKYPLQTVQCNVDHCTNYLCANMPAPAATLHNGTELSIPGNPCATPSMSLTQSFTGNQGKDFMFSPFLSTSSPLVPFSSPVMNANTFSPTTSWMSQTQHMSTITTHEEHYELLALDCALSERIRRVRLGGSIRFLLPVNVKVTDFPKVHLHFRYSLQGEDLLLDLVVSKYKRPTAIQAQMLPAILHGHDVIAVSQPGSGKTLGFLLPAFIHIEARKNSGYAYEGPTVIVVVPNKYIAKQVADSVIEYRDSKVNYVVITKATSVHDQEAAFADEVDMVIGTMGDILTAIRSGNLNVTNVTFIVYSDVDMLTGLLNTQRIRDLNNCINNQRQIVWCSGTWNSDLESLAITEMQNPLMVRDHCVYYFNAQHVHQIADVAKNGMKLQHLQDVLRCHDGNQHSLVICSDGSSVDFVVRNCGMPALAMYSDMCEPRQAKNMRCFTNGEYKLLVVDRGYARTMLLDIFVTYAIYFDMPEDIREYLSIFRNIKCNVIKCIIGPNDRKIVNPLCKVFLRCKQNVNQELYVLNKEIGPIHGDQYMTFCNQSFRV